MRGLPRGSRVMATAVALTLASLVLTWVLLLAVSFAGRARRRAR